MFEQKEVEEGAEVRAHQNTTKGVKYRGEDVAGKVKLNTGEGSSVPDSYKITSVRDMNHI